MNPATAADDALAAAVDTAERRIWSMLWDIHPSRRRAVAEAAVRAARPVLNGGERERTDTAGTPA